MKNIFVLSTNNPSRLFYLASNLHLEQGQLISPKNYQHIYITSDEEIKEGDWWLNLKTNDVDKCTHRSEVLVFNSEKYQHIKKIILTTDQDLIKNGVQAIDDEFLEWFVKNPSCEEVEIQDWYSIYLSCCRSKEECYCNKKRIIIPKEEPKFENSIKNSINVMSIANSMFGKKEEPKQEYEYIGECKGNNDDGCFMNSSGHNCGCYTRKLIKQETLEEVRVVKRTELYNSILSIVKQIPRKEVEGDAMDAPSCAYELEQLFLKWQQETPIDKGEGEAYRQELEKEMFDLEQELDIPSHLRWHNSKPKQRLEKYSERFDNKDNELVEGIFNPDTWGKRMVDDAPKEITLEEVFNDEKREGVKKIIDQHKVLKGLSLINPLHLQMTSNGHGEFPDGYKLTEKGIQYIIEKLNKE